MMSIGPITIMTSDNNSDIDKLAKEVFAEGKADEWLNHPHPMLDNKTPNQVRHTKEGYEKVRQILGSIKWGFSS